MAWATTAPVVALLTVAACSEPAGPRSSPQLGRRLIAGEQVACALTSEGRVHCWGLNTLFWEYGAPPGVRTGGIAPTEAVAPVLSSLARGVSTHFCGITASRDGVCWARDGSGQLGRGYVASVGNTSATVAGGIHWGDISVGRITTCGLDEAGVGYCWGRNQYGTVGTSRIPIDAFVHTPSPVDGGYLFSSIGAGWLHACAVTTTGAAYCWGNNEHGQLGIGTADTVARTSPVLVSGNLNFREVSLGSRHSCGITAEGEAWCWGANSTGQLGDGTLEARTAPTRVAGGHKFVQIVTSSGFGNGALTPLPVELIGMYGHTCALATDGRAWCWGWNGSGELGDGTQTDRLVPTAVAGGRTFTTLAVGGAFSCGMLDDYVWCWGSNLVGQVGSGDGDQVLLTPRAVDSPFRAP